MYVSPSNYDEQWEDEEGYATDENPNDRYNEDEDCLPPEETEPFNMIEEE